MSYLSVIVKLLGGWRAAAFALVAVLALSTAGVQTMRLSHSQAAIAGFQRDAAQAAAYAAEQTTKASEAARAAEHARSEAIAFADKTYQEGLRDGKAAADRVLADVAAGRLVLRERFTCKAPSGAAQAAAGSGIGDGQGGAGLSGADVQFLVRFAQESDAVVRQLSAAQQVIEADRGPDASRAGN